MKKSSSLIMYVLVVLIVVCLAAGGAGYYKILDTKTNDPMAGNKGNNNSNREYTVTYKYYLDGIESKTEITDEKEAIESYSF